MHVYESEYGEAPHPRVARKHMTFDEYMDLVRQPSRGAPDRESSNTGGFEFAETNTYEEALALADNGWPEGLEKIKRFSGELTGVTAMEQERTRYKYSEAGDEADVSRFLEGDPECMMQPEVERVPGFGKVVKVVFNESVSCGVSTNAMFWRGAVGVAIIDLIETSGLRAEVIMATGVFELQNDFDEMQYTTVLKKPDDPLELDRMAFQLAHPSSFRRLSFRMIESLGAENIPSGYGKPMSVPFSGEDVIEIDPMQFGFGNEVNSDTDAKKLCGAIIEKYIRPLGILEEGAMA